MSKKQEKKKNLRRSLCAIINIYLKQKGKEKRKQLNTFIDQKIAEIISFSDNLSHKKKNITKKERSKDDNLKTTPLSDLGPSSALTEELHKSKTNNGDFEHVVTN